MDKKTVGLIGAVAGLATIGSAQAAIAPAPALQASSYVDLLAPVADAAALLKADDAARAPMPAPDAVQEAQYYYGPPYPPYYYYPYNYYYPPRYYYYRRYHHHHHRYYRRPYHHPHHHHHHAAVRRPSGRDDAVG